MNVTDVGTQRGLVLHDSAKVWDGRIFPCISFIQAFKLRIYYSVLLFLLAESMHFLS